MGNIDIQLLSPPQRFMFEYGMFISFWGHFDLMMETAICHLAQSDPIENCKSINRLTSGEKRRRLTPLLTVVSPDAVQVLDQVFDIAERNDWIHGVVLNPRKDFSTLTRFRVHSNPFSVENVPIDLSSNPFAQFYDAYEHFEEALERTFKVNIIDMCNSYVSAILK